MKAILFDLDDTLVDHQHCYRTSITALQTQYPALQHKSFADIEKLYVQWLDVLHAQVLAGTLSLPEARRERFRQIFLACDAPLPDDQLDEVAQFQAEAYRAAQRPVDGVIPLLEYLRAAHLQIGVLTNHLLAEQVAKLKQCDLEAYVDVLISSEEAGVPKPDPTMFHMALTRLNCEPQDTVMVGDSWQSDVIGATALGIRALWLNRYEHTCPDPTLATEFESYVPLEAMLERLGV